MTRITIDIDTEFDDHTRGGLLAQGFGRRPALTNVIGVVSSIPCGQLLQNAFANGLNNSQISVIYTPNLGYGGGNRAALDAAIQTDLTHNYDLIVTAGGNVAYAAAAETIPITGHPTTQMHFLSLMGSIPTSPPASFWGGVSLESYASNTDRIGFFTGAGINMGQIGLLGNTNSHMANAEAGAWTNATNNNNIFYAATGPNGTNINTVPAFAAGFNAATAAGVIAIVVSADPFFQYARDNFVTAANAWLAADNTKRICYPAYDFVNAAPAPTRSVSIIYGPQLGHAYNLLGQLAAFALHAQTAAPVLRLPNTHFPYA